MLAGSKRPLHEVVNPVVTLLDLLKLQVDRNPAAPAVVSNAGTLCYGDLWKRALAIAGQIRHISPRSGERIGLLSENSADYVTAYYGVLLAGNVVVPLNSQSKAPDLEAWLRHSDSVMLLADPNHNQLPDVRNRMTSLDVIGIDAVAQTSIEETESLRLDAAGPEDLAAILYTSGTTGRPKGVMLSHSNLVSNTLAIMDYLSLDHEDSIVSVLPFYYSYGHSVLHTHLAAGARIVIENQSAFPARIWERIAGEKASGFAGVPATFAFLLDRVRPERYDLSRLRYVTQAGGSMPVAITRKLKEMLPDATKIFVMYGQTEATARITYLPPERLEDKPGSVGIPINGVELEIRNAAGDPVSPGTVGEIHVTGPNVMSGYWKDSDATRKTLRDGWLSTGDLGYLDGDGFLYIDGRKSEMIKTGAHRVSPLDIEEAIAELESVLESAAIGVSDNLLGEVIKVYVVCSPGASLSRRELLAHCRKRLAVYKVPKEVRFVEQLPRTPSGKIQRHLLAGMHGSETHGEWNSET